MIETLNYRQSEWPTPPGLKSKKIPNGLLQRPWAEEPSFLKGMQSRGSPKKVVSTSPSNAY